MEGQLPFDGEEEQKVYGHHGNYGPHLKSQLAPSNKVFGRDMLTHPPHTPDIVLANYYLFRSLSNYLRDRAFGKVTTIKDHLSDFYSP
jgi:hypothetical protein